MFLVEAEVLQYSLVVMCLAGFHMPRLSEEPRVTSPALKRIEAGAADLDA
ncbi:unnamed protein product [Nezara viridula]|uniref:Uncharacterized protein n=1 Tax=Nezara viridula TaxID=85310 RepID=A0A9P0EAA0_NEZVI|nr:unnamed protein product [Nezara viridula]